MGSVFIKFIQITIMAGFWASVVFTFLPILTIIVAGILQILSGTVLIDLFYMIQLYAPFNFNVILLWSLTIAFAWFVWWLATTAYNFVSALFR